MASGVHAVNSGGGAPVVARAALPVAFAIPALFVVENILGSPLGTYAGLPVRLALFAASLAVLAWYAAVRGAFLRETAVPALSVLAFLAWQFVWATIVPAAAGTELPYTVAEFRPFLLLAAPVLGAATAPTHEALRRLVRALQRLVVRATLVLAVAQLAIWSFAVAVPQVQAFIFVALAAAFPGARGALYVGPMPDGFFRVFWISSLWLPIAFFWAPLVVRGAARLRVARLILLAAIFVSYSRGIWLGMAVGAVAAAPLWLGRLDARTVGRRALAGVAALVLVGGVAVATGQAARALDRIASTSARSGPEDERVSQIAPLQRVWERAPFLGIGYGGYAADYIRAPEAPYSYENTAYALLAKLGAVGTAGFLALVAFWLATAWRVRRRAPADAPAFVAALVTLLVASLTNPLLINFVGMTALASLLFQWIALAGRVAAGPAATRAEASGPGPIAPGRAA